MRTLKERLSSRNIYLFFIGFVSALPILFIYGTLFNSPVDNSIRQAQAIQDPDTFPQGYRIVSPEIPDKIDFAGEEVPLYNFEVYERIDREILVNTYWHSFTILAIKKAHRYFPVIEPILKQYNIPDDFKYVAVIESGLSNVISPAGATGIWQFMEGAGKEYGLEINEVVDQRYHVQKSTEAACRYLKSAYDRFGSWTLAAASYNMGMSGLTRQLQRQKTNNYYNLVLSEETSRYISRIIALKLILRDPEKYGFDIKDEDMYQQLPSYDLEVPANIDDLADFAISKGINYKTLKVYNPWLRETYLKDTPSSSYVIQMPVEGTVSIIRE